ncbi:MAG TPA: TetR/AcrR family transcriptional regulator [Actinomycetospora sp.]|nr:TetR/AcrR family transcriptional regulator [Actinomycetospora sp.]
MSSGARRSEEARRAILASALAITGELGYERASIEAIARRAGSGKQTIYRWWPTKAAVLQEAVEDANGASTAFPDTGEVVGDLRSQMHGVVAFFVDPELGPVFRGLIAAAQSDPEVADATLRSLFGPRRQVAIDRLVAEQQRGRLDPQADAELLVDLLYGPLYYRLLVTRGVLDDHYVDQLVSAVVVPLTR